ncbi:MAG: hypothetical protein ACRC3Y_19140 [Romboutsia sp.]|uniref:hypothetical protein n=1 Tax=Romboutsia sp. TaxID=1965302 RepID=UPI003F3BB03F
MSFINNCSTIIRRSNKEMFCVHYDSGIVFDYYNEHGNYVSSKKIKENRFVDFTNSYFTLDKYDNIYGIYNNNGLKMIDVPKYSNSINEKPILDYDVNKFNILFPYIHTVDDSIHIIYHVFNNNSSNSSALLHHYRHNGLWVENKIDFVNQVIADNFIVIWVQNSPIIFYFNLVNGYEELFFSRFNSSTVTWSNPIQITNNKKNKLYLSVIKDNMNFYHIVFCENSGNGYAVKYINGYLNENSLDIDTSTYITGPSTCMYPSFIKEKSKLYIMWVNYGRLHTSYSTDLGKSWSEHTIDDSSLEDDFVRANFFSNFESDNIYNVGSVFTIHDDIGLLGF